MSQQPQQVDEARARRGVARLEAERLEQRPVVLGQMIEIEPEDALEGLAFDHLARTRADGAPGVQDELVWVFVEAQERHAVSFLHCPGGGGAGRSQTLPRDRPSRTPRGCGGGRSARCSTPLSTRRRDGRSATRPSTSPNTQARRLTTVRPALVNRPARSSPSPRSRTLPVSRIVEVAPAGQQGADPRRHPEEVERGDSGGGARRAMRTRAARDARSGRAWWRHLAPGVVAWWRWRRSARPPPAPPRRRPAAASPRARAAWRPDRADSAGRTPESPRRSSRGQAEPLRRAMLPARVSRAETGRAGGWSPVAAGGDSAARSTTTSSTARRGAAALPRARASMRGLASASVTRAPSSAAASPTSPVPAQASSKPRRSRTRRRGGRRCGVAAVTGAPAAAVPGTVAAATTAPRLTASPAAQRRQRASWPNVMTVLIRS